MNIIIHQLGRARRLALAAALTLALLAPVFAHPTPAAAETVGQRSTRNIILGALAVGTGLVIYNNYHQKYVAAHTLVGYTRDGGRIYADGRIVYPDGTTVYTSDNGRTVCTWDGYGGYENQCRGTVYGYYPQGMNAPQNCKWHHNKHGSWCTPGRGHGDDDEQGDEDNND